MVKRGKLDIMRDMLKIIQENRNSIQTTPLMRKSNLSSIRFKEYYKSLLEKNLIQEVLDHKKEKYLVLTEKGFRFLEKYRTIMDFIDEFDL